MTPDSAPTLTIVGLGPGDWETLTIEAISTLRAAHEVFVRTAVHPSLDPIRSQLPEVEFRTFDYLYESLPSLNSVYQRIVEEIARLTTERGRLVYAVPGSPSLGESTVAMLLQRFRGSDVTIRIVQGLSYVEPILAAVGCVDASWVQVIDGSELSLLSRENAVGEAAGEDEPLPWRAPMPTAPLVVSYLYDRETASGVKLWLGRYYPDEHLVDVVQSGGTSHAATLSIPLHDLDRVDEVDHRTALFVPALAEIDDVRTFAGMMQLTRRLRGPGGCPWDREQTHASLKPYLLEETYEVLDALDSGDPSLIAEEFGDLLYQITIHAQVGAEEGTFTIEDIIENIMAKLIGRHPHVFGDMELESAQDVRHAWESFKQRQKPKRASVLEEIPTGLPALPQSNLMQKRAASVGFEWPGIDQVLEKVTEELGELRPEIAEDAAKERQREELGDVLFAMVSVARHLRIDPEEALRLANRKFADRFASVEERAVAQGKTLRDLSPAELDAFWQEAKGSTGTTTRE